MGIKKRGQSTTRAAYDAYNTRKEKDIISYPIHLVKKGLHGVETVMIQASDSFIKEVLNTEGSFDMEFGGQLRFNICVKANNSTKTFELEDFIGTKNKNQKFASELVIAPEGELYIKVRMEAKTKVNIKAMNIINFESSKNNEDEEFNEVSGFFELEGNIYYTRRYHFKSDDTKPYYQDAIVFGGIAGEYEVKIKKLDNKDEEINKMPDNKSDSTQKKFIIMESNSITFEPVPIF